MSAGADDSNSGPFPDDTGLPECGLAIPLAAEVLYTWGVILSPAVGAVLMSASTVIVAINARLLKMEKSSND